MGYNEGEWRAEGKWVFNSLTAFRNLEKESERESFFKIYQEEYNLLGAFLGRRELSPETEAVLQKYALPADASLEAQEEVRQKLNELRHLLSWIAIDGEIEKLGKGAEPNWEELSNHLGFKIRVYRALNFEDLANQMETLRDTSARRIKESKTVFSNVTVEDTDDPAILSRMGALHPELMTCMNPNGNPTFTQFVVTMLGSKNMKMVLVKGSMGEILATARLKVKQLEEGEPVYFLESLYTRKGYDFRKEMLTHLTLKARQFASDRIPPLVVMDEVPRGLDKEAHPWVYGTGAYTKEEYVGPVFRLRRAKDVKHRGRIVEMGSLASEVLDLEESAPGPDAEKTSTHLRFGAAQSLKPLNSHTGRGASSLVHK